MQVKHVARVRADLMTRKPVEPGTWKVIAIKGEKWVFSIQNFVFFDFEFQIQYSFALELIELLCNLYQVVSLLSNYK
jgi:hypothetical protein